MNRSVLIGAAGLLCVLACQGAAAQWAWKDDAGHTVFSDQPPPSNIPRAHIIRSPSGATPVVAPAAADTPPASSGDATPAGDSKPKSLAEQDLEFKKRLKDNADAAKKAQEAQAAKEANAQRCADARAAQAAIQSGQRVTTVDAQGNKSYLDDSQIAAQRARLQGALAGC
jgi:transcription elongation factor